MYVRQLGFDWFECLAPAKLNLFLEVRGRLPDGYHELETVMCGISLYDTLWFQPVQDNTNVDLEVVPVGAPFADVPHGAENLLVRAVTQLQQAQGVAMGARLRLFKRIPTQAGMGGGSSDAAAALLLANQAWELGLARSQLLPFAAELGSDVSFFLGDSPAVCRGRGEQLQPFLGAIPRQFVVVKPHEGLATAAVYRELSLDQTPRPLPETLGHAQIFNRLQAPALALLPKLNRMMDRMRALGLSPWITGSGSALFAPCAGRARALRTANQLRQLGCQGVYAATSLGRRGPH